ncbi:condensation domain-containing protein, partial [Piscinibacter terrae]
MFSSKQLSVEQREHLLRIAEAAKPRRRSPSNLPIVPAARDSALPLSFAQQRLWFLAQMPGVSEAYHIPLGLSLRGRLDRSALRRALDRIVARHEVLRTTFEVVDGAPVQRIAAADIGFALEDIDLRHHEDPQAQVQHHAEEEAARPFDLQAGPLVRGRLLCLGEHEHVLLATMHHVISDGWSLGLLTSELSSLYVAFSQGAADPLAPLGVQYADFAAWQRQRADAGELAIQSAFWKRTLAGAPPLLELPMDRPRPSEQDHAGASVVLTLDRSLVAELKALCAAQGATLFMALLAGWALLLGRLSGARDLVIGTPVANRNRTELEPLIGLFVNTLALRVELDDASTVEDLLRQVKSRSLEAQQHQDLPFEQVVDIANPPRSLAHTPLFQVMFAWQNLQVGTLQLPELTLGPVGGRGEIAKFDLTLTLGEADGGVAGALEYATALFDRATVQRYAGYLVRILKAMSSGARRMLGELEWLDDQERERVLQGWNETRRPYERDRCVHELIEARAAMQGQATALVQGEHSLSY